jgi:D-3-phosphoglycerate dehydrogenase
VVILDRPAWYEPVIEREVLAGVGAEVVVGWAEVADAPPEALRDSPPEEIGRERYSTITAAFVPPRIGTEDRLIEMARDADAVLVVQARVTARVLESLPRLRAVGRYGIGVDTVDIEAATRLGVAVVYVPGFCAREVADHAMMYVLGFGRRLPYLHGLMKQGVWGRAGASPMPALYGQTLGLIAFGEIGREMALRARSFGLTVLAHDPFVDPALAGGLGVTLVGLDELLSRSDYVSVHAPLNAKTRHMLGERELRLMKPTACLINTARGPVVDEAALVRALQEGWIAGAGLDVFEQEPLDPSSPLLEMENVLLTPHTAGLSDESQVDSRYRVCRAIAAILEGGWPEGRDLYNPAVKAGLRAED